ncbi:hypothetical protein FRC04_010881 [Tulasnella sp. 424]|nr:hypothetical protein FRC04_010881 [Tulasnella sp. 424]
MVDDYPMNDEADRDAEMDDYDGYYDDAAMVDESGGGSTQLKEYDMEGDIEAEYEQPMMVAEPADGMVTEQPAPTIATVADIPIMEEPTAAPSPADVPILPTVAETAVPQTLPTPPQPTPGPVPTDLPAIVFSIPPAEVPTVLSPVTPAVETAVNPTATSITSEPQNPSPPPEIAPTTPQIEATSVPEPQVEGTLEQEESARASPVVPGETSQNHSAGNSTVEAPVGIEKSTPLPTQPTEETAQAPVENQPTIVVPHITLYYDEQAFILFAPHSETEDSSPSLLSGKFELFVAPLNQLLCALRSQEPQHFSEGEDFVFGLEYPDLDLCIDENSKYAATYSLQDICDALVACNHANITLTLYQVTDFEYSLKRRLGGILPEFPPLESATPLQPSANDSDVQSEVHIHIPETLPLQPDPVEAQPTPVAEPTPKPGAPEDDPIQNQPQEIQVSNVESKHGQTDQQTVRATENETETETETIGVTVTEVPLEVPATELPAEVEENDEAEALEADDDADALEDEDLGEPVPADDTQTSSNDMSGHAVEGTGVESAESSATLESSVHGDAELEYGPEDGQPEDQLDEAYEDPQAAPAPETGTRNHLTSQEENSPLESNELIESRSQADSQEVNEDAVERDELGDPEALELPSGKIDETSAQDDSQSALLQTGSSADTSEYEEEYEEYDEYDEAEDQVECTAYPEEETTRDGVVAGPELVTPSNEPASTPPVSTLTRITPPGKRTLGERDAEDDYDYGIGEFYGADRSETGKGGMNRANLCPPSDSLPLPNFIPDSVYGMAKPSGFPNASPQSLALTPAS